MAFGDVFAGWQQAAHEHATQLFQMQQQSHQATAQLFAKMAENQDLPPESRSWLMQGALAHANAINDPKTAKQYEYDAKGNTIKIPVSKMVASPTPPPINISGSTGTPGTTPEGVPQAATAEINPQTIQPPTPPPTEQTVMQSPFQVRSPEEQQAIAQHGLGGQLATQTQAEQNEIAARAHTFKTLYPDMDPQIAAMAASKMPVGAMSILHTSPVQDVPGTEVQLAADAFGHPIDRNDTYTVLHDALGKPVTAYPKNPGIVGGLKFAQDDKGHWVGYTTDKFGKVEVRQDLGLTPPQGVPTTSFNYNEQLVPQADGTFKFEPKSSETIRTRGGAATPAAPTAPTKAGAAAAPTPPTPPPSSANPSGTTGTSAAPNTPGRVVGARAFTPAQIETNQKTGAAFSNTVERMVNVLSKADILKNLVSASKVELSTEPTTGKLLISRMAGMNEDETSLASDYASLSEDINVLRNVYGISPSRGQQAFQALQLQKGAALGDTGVFKNVLRNSLKSVVDQLSVINRNLKQSNQPMPITDGIRKAYLLLNGSNVAKAKAQAAKDGWQ